MANMLGQEIKNGCHVGVSRFLVHVLFIQVSVFSYTCGAADFCDAYRLDIKTLKCPATSAVIADQLNQSKTDPHYPACMCKAKKIATDSCGSDHKCLIAAQKLEDIGMASEQYQSDTAACQANA